MADEYGERPGAASRSGNKEPKMPVIAVDHVQLAMPAGGEDRARSFYRDLLGVPETPKPADLVARGGCWFESERVKIHLGVDKAFHPATKAHPGLLVTGLKGIVAGCRQLGLEVIEVPSFGGCERVFVNDPFGNRIELMEKA
jgi:catechol 2,3-dioxygenase-like lactoylglutathione lyase family enzyme